MAAGSRTAVRLIAAFQASSSRTWPSIARRASSASRSPRAVEGGVEGVAIRRRQGRTGARRASGAGPADGPGTPPVGRACAGRPGSAPGVVVRHTALGPGLPLARSGSRPGFPVPLAGLVTQAVRCGCRTLGPRRRPASTRLSTNPRSGRRSCGQLDRDAARRAVDPSGGGRRAPTGSSGRARSRPAPGRRSEPSPSASSLIGAAGRRRVAPGRGQGPPDDAAPRAPPPRGRGRAPSAASIVPRSTVGRAGQDEDERGAGARHGRDVEVAAHPPGEVAGDRQAEARCR